MAEQKRAEGEFPKNSSEKPDEFSTTGDGHPPRTGERETQEKMAGQGLGQNQGTKDQNMSQSAGAGTASNKKPQGQ
ncbi:MAG: hypothetical protein WKF84_10790 [Pyrinomonadaceae bacterium]